MAVDAMEGPRERTTKGEVARVDQEVEATAEATVGGEIGA